MLIEDVLVEYDSQGRIKYHPELHNKQGLPWSEEDLEYLCKYESIDDRQTIAMALGRTVTTVDTRLHLLKKTGRFEYYKNLNKHW
ncbi:DNA-entry nuclease [Peribacillus acanthi]|uniref:DNA-entry nuclease n=1 Tax=Peribacillus acanthi TaxID=2171554 RepID=UPI000D3E1821|nr:DNA-entry nuclease [Peribacillus acanthi]